MAHVFKDFSGSARKMPDSEKKMSQSQNVYDRLLCTTFHQALLFFKFSVFSEDTMKKKCTRKKEKSYNQPAVEKSKKQRESKKMLPQEKGTLKMVLFYCIIQLLLGMLPSLAEPGKLRKLLMLFTF